MDMYIIFRFYGENTENLERLLTMVSNDVIAVSKGLLPRNLFTETETVSGTHDEAIHQRRLVSRKSFNAVATVCNVLKQFTINVW